MVQAAPARAMSSPRSFDSSPTQTNTAQPRLLAGATQLCPRFANSANALLSLPQHLWAGQGARWSKRTCSGKFAGFDWREELTETLTKIFLGLRKNFCNSDWSNSTIYAECKGGNSKAGSSRIPA